MQKVTLIGNLGKDPEERFTANNHKVVTFSLAVAVKKDVVIWYQVNIWEERISMFEGILKSIHKGSKICIIGDLGAPQPYMNKSGEPSVRLHVQPFSMNFVGSVAGEKKPENPVSAFDQEIPF